MRLSAGALNRRDAYSTLGSATFGPSCSDATESIKIRVDYG
jgi:hypothetical protein